MPRCLPLAAGRNGKASQLGFGGVNAVEQWQSKASATG